VAWLETGRGAIFVGDLMHTPVQFARPQDACLFDLDAEQARASPGTVLGAAARAGTLVLPAHFAGHGATSIAHLEATHFTIGQWADLTPL
jgi:glyoxylase-like metal-dependent hydrolase (beta-lactamase superfamily II)